MSYSASQIVKFIKNDWETGGEIVCAGSDDEFDFEEEQCIEHYNYSIIKWSEKQP